uniref:Uncharacterized protein n=1 Tax=uncultured Acidobacteriota bacterium TaxID=171953 RepID=H5SDB2_9BACT|nr:hypothetical protein HGMM_F13B08C06 [uncultured Acidobacteriota bacterium]
MSGAHEKTESLADKEGNGDATLIFPAHLLSNTSLDVDARRALERKPVVRCGTVGRRPGINWSGTTIRSAAGKSPAQTGRHAGARRDGDPRAGEPLVGDR